MPSSRNGGFTLVELLVAISVMLIIAAIGFTFFTQAEKAARDSKRKEDLAEIRKGLEQYYGATRTYPADIYASTFSNTTYFSKSYTPEDPLSSSTDQIKYSYYPPSGTCLKFILCASPEIVDDDNNNRKGAPANACDPVETPDQTGKDRYCISSLLN